MDNSLAQRVAQLDRADGLRAQAAAARQEAADSFERCDTDGFLSQWASGLSAQRLSLQAEIEEAGGLIEVRALFDLEGNLVPAKIIDTKYGTSWALLDPSDLQGQFLGWFNPSKHSDPAKAAQANARKGYYLGTVRVPGRADLAGSGTGLSGAASVYVYAKRTDGGFSASPEIVDNGQPTA